MLTDCPLSCDLYTSKAHSTACDSLTAQTASATSLKTWQESCSQWGGAAAAAAIAS